MAVMIPARWRKSLLISMVMTRFPAVVPRPIRKVPRKRVELNPKERTIAPAMTIANPSDTAWLSAKWRRTIEVSGVKNPKQKTGIEVTKPASAAESPSSF